MPGSQRTHQKGWPDMTTPDPMEGAVPPPRPVPFHLPWPQLRVACPPVIGDDLLSHYPGVANALAERDRRTEAASGLEAQGTAMTAYPISRLSPEVSAFIDVDPECGCWVWWHTNCEGYGYAPAAIRHGNPEWKAHRFIYTELVGPIPSGFTLDHVRARGCLFRACCWPTHLEPVTHAENSRRGRSTAAADSTRPHWQPGCARFELRGSAWLLSTSGQASGSRSFTTCSAAPREERYERGLVALRAHCAHGNAASFRPLWPVCEFPARWPAFPYDRGHDAAKLVQREKHC